MNMSWKKAAAGLAALCASAMALSGCGSSTSNEAAAEKNVISYATIEPKSKLIPGNTNETPAFLVLRELFSGLVTYNSDGTTTNEVAKEIKSNDDSSQFTITLNDGWKFTNGEP